MSMDGSIELTWADGDYKFRLAIDELRMLEETRDCGTAEIFNRLTNNQWFVDDMRETIRIGLIGGGLSPVEALKKVRTYVDGCPKTENVAIAYAILLAALVGPDIEDDQHVDDDGSGTKKTHRLRAPLRKRYSNRY